MAISITKPTVGASQDTWGTTLNAALDTLVAAANGTAGYSAPNLEANNWKIQDVAITTSGTELNLLTGLTAGAAEINLLDGAVGGTVVADKAAVYGPLGQLAATTLELPENWKIKITGTGASSFLKVEYNGNEILSISTSGALVVENDITAFGSA